MNTKQLRYVLTLANEGSFSRAAEKLNISQPSLSQYIRKIEDEVGMSLFVRSNNFVRLSDAGKVYLETGQNILQLEHNMLTKFDDLRSNQQGSIILGVSAHRSAALMPNIVAKFHKQYPGIRLILNEKPRSALIEAAEHGAYDLCLTTPTIDENVFNILSTMHEEILLAVPANSDSDKRLSSTISVNITNEPSRINISTLSNEPFIYLQNGHPMQTILEEIKEQYDLNLPCTVECTSLETMLFLVRSGLGCAFLPACMQQLCPNSNEIRFYSLTPTPPQREIVLIHRREQYLSEPMIALSQLIQQSI